MKFAPIAAGLLLMTSLLARIVPTVESPSAFAEDVKQVREGHGVSYVEEMTVEGNRQTIVTKDFIADDGRKRMEMAGGPTTIFDNTGSIRITLIQRTHTALVPEAKEDLGFNHGEMFLDWLQKLKKLCDKPDKELGQRELDGKRVTGFVVTQPGRGTFTMWTANATGDPVRIEYDMQVNGATAHITMKDFQFHQTFDESLFSFDVPPGYEVFGRPKDGKFEPPAGLEFAWSQKGAWFGIAAAVGRPTVYGLKYQGQVAVLGAAGKEIAKFKVGEQANSIRTANLLAGKDCQFVTFGNMQRAVEARNAEGELLWSYPSEKDDERRAVDDVCPADLDGDGLDEVIIGYSGFTGLHVLDSKGHLLWKNTDRGNIWDVAAGDVDGDGKPEVLATCVTGKVQVFNAAGKHLRDLDPDFYASMVRAWQPAEAKPTPTSGQEAFRQKLDELKKLAKEFGDSDLEPAQTREKLAKLRKELVDLEYTDVNDPMPDLPKSATRIIVAGRGKEKMLLAALNLNEKTLWSLDLSAVAGRAAICAERPWLALSLQDGNVRVVDLALGKEIAHMGGQGGGAGVAWQPVVGGAPLLVIETHEELQAFRITAEQSK